MTAKGKHIRYIANGQGAQSILLCVLSGERKFPCDVWIAADTGEEKKRRLNSGEIVSAKEYFKEVTLPLSRLYGIPAYFIRTLTADRQRLPPISEYIRQTQLARGRPNAINIPLYVEGRGQLKQSCTDRWKIQGMNQKLKSLGATSAHSYQGIHAGEAWRRVKGIYLRTEDYGDYQLDIRQSTDGGKEIMTPEQYQRRLRRRPDWWPPHVVQTVDKEDWFYLQRQTTSVEALPLLDQIGRDLQGPFRQIYIGPSIVWWLTHSYPLADRGIDRDGAREELERRKIPYLLSSECDICPHQDAPRWLRMPDEAHEEAAVFEDEINAAGVGMAGGRRAFYLTDRRRPLREVIAEWKRQAQAGEMPDTPLGGCESSQAVCFV